MRKLAVGILCALFISVPTITSAQEQDVIVKAQVITVLEQHEEHLGGLTATSTIQTLDARILQGADAGQIVRLTNDYPIQLKAGDSFYVIKYFDPDTGETSYRFRDVNRLPGLALLGALLLLLIVFIGGKQGVRGFLSLIGSLVFIIYVLLPGMLAGYSPVLISVGVASLIVVLGSYITHGFTKVTTSAVIGMILTVVLTGVLAYFSIDLVHLTGYDSDESVFLSASAGVNLDFAGILLGGMLIGILGILYDAAIGQSVAIDELHQIAPHVSRKKIYLRALRIGREHIGALINTLAIAYVGASLPLLLLITHSPDTSVFLTINRDLFATEISRVFIGSIGLILTVPITTLVSLFLLVHPAPAEEGVVSAEEEEMDKVSHTHGG